MGILEIELLICFVTPNYGWGFNGAGWWYSTVYPVQTFVCIYKMGFKIIKKCAIYIAGVSDDVAQNMVDAIRL